MDTSKTQYNDSLQVRITRQTGSSIKTHNFSGKQWRPDSDSAQKTTLKMTYLIPWAHRSLLLTSVIISIEKLMK